MYLNFFVGLPITGIDSGLLLLHLILHNMIFFSGEKQHFKILKRLLHQVNPSGVSTVPDNFTLIQNKKNTHFHLRPFQIFVTFPVRINITFPSKKKNKALCRSREYKFIVCVMTMSKITFCFQTSYFSASLVRWRA